MIYIYIIIYIYILNKEYNIYKGNRRSGGFWWAVIYDWPPVWCMWAALTLSSWLRPVALEVLSQIHRSIDQNNACVRHGFVSTTVGSNGSKDDWFMVLISLFHQFMDQVQMRPRNYYCLHCLLFFFTTWIRNVFFFNQTRRHWTDKLLGVLLMMGLPAFVLTKGRCAQLSNVNITWNSSDSLHHLQHLM